MTLASTSRMKVSYAPETVFGETPTVGNHRAVSFTGESLNFNITKETSEEINEYRGSSSAIQVSAEASGSINGEMRYGEYDDLLARTLQNNWEAYGVKGVGDTFEATITATEITASVATSGTSDFTTLKPGQWFMLGGGAGVNAGVLFRVHPSTAPTALTITLDPSTPATPAVAVADVTVLTSRLTNGVDQTSVSIEKCSADTGEYFLYRGMTPSQLNLALNQGARSTVEFAFMGRDSIAGTATALPGVREPSQDFPIMSGTSGTACALWYGGSPLVGTFISSLSLSYDNTLRMQNALCSLGAVGVGSGTIAVSVDISVYFASGRAFYDELLSNANKEVSFTTFDVEGNGYVFTMPKANVASYEVVAGSRDADLMANVTLTGLMHLGAQLPHLQGKVMVIDRIGAPLE